MDSQELLIASLRRRLTFDLGVGVQPSLSVAFEGWDWLPAVAEKAEIPKSKPRLDLSPDLLGSLASADASVLAPAVVIHVHIPLRAALFDLHAHSVRSHNPGYHFIHDTTHVNRL